MLANRCSYESTDFLWLIVLQSCLYNRPRKFHTYPKILSQLQRVEQFLPNFHIFGTQSSRHQLEKQFDHIFSILHQSEASFLLGMDIHLSTLPCQYTVDIPGRISQRGFQDDKPFPILIRQSSFTRAIINKIRPKSKVKTPNATPSWGFLNFAVAIPKTETNNKSVPITVIAWQNSSWRYKSI